MRFVLFLILALIAFGVAVQVRRRHDLSSRLAAMGVSTRGLQIIGVIALLLAASQTLRVIPAGHVGVVDFFGYVSERPLHAGINVVNPFANVIKLSIKTQERRAEMRVPSQEGLTVGLEISVLYRLDGAKAPEVYKTVGREGDYIQVILIPNFRSVVRGVTAKYEAKALYTSMREEVALNIQQQLHAATSVRGVLVESTPLRQVALPTDLSTAIEEKLRAEQESQRMEFVLQREAKEAERKRIEATGIADFQKIVAEGISDQLLRWKGIEATENLAKSENAKVVVIGSGEEGLPIILGGQ
ncbi:MAG: prohibitin family protein [Fidelibacterota bacterium]|nr:MAG: prohibitin family protein [Candidatus Neomarinimicrobiota bacterium]